MIPDTETAETEAGLSKSTTSSPDEETTKMTPRAQERSEAGGEMPPQAMSEDTLETLNRLAGLGRANLEALSQASHTALQGGMQCHEIMMGYADQRMQRRYELFEQTRLLNNLTDAVRLQADFGRVFFDDYFRMIHDLAGLGQRLANENLTRLHETATGTVVKMDEVA